MASTSLSQVLVPQQLNFCREFRVSEPVDTSQHEARLRVELTGGDIDVLGLGLDLPAAACLCPLDRRANKRLTDSLMPEFRVDTDVSAHR
jgi:hypothetical protein